MGDKSFMNMYEPKIYPSKILSLIYNTIKFKKSFNNPQTVMSWYGEYRRPKLFDAVNGLGQFLKNPTSEINESYEQLFKLLSAYAIFCKNRNIKLVVALFPQRFQVQKQDWENTIFVYKLKEAAFDISIPNKCIYEFCEANNIICINPTELMIKKHQEYKKSLYCPNNDMHWNKLGHNVFF